MLTASASRTKRTSSARLRRKRRPDLGLPFEMLEGRIAPAVIQVLSAADNTNAVTTVGHAGTLADPFQAPSLRSAISFANTNAGADTVTFAPVLDTVPITLTLVNAGGVNEDLNATGDFDVNDALTIVGNGPTNTIIEAGTTTLNGIDKVFAINPGGLPDVNFTMTGVTVQNGRNTQPFGAADFSYTAGGLDYVGVGTSTLTLTGDVFQNNTNVNGYGGGINIDTLPAATSVINIADTTITGNTSAGTGGGINLQGDGPEITMSHVTITNNTTTGPALLTADGGGVHILLANNDSAPDIGGFLTINSNVNGGSTISNNVAAGTGGGISVAGGGGQNVIIQDTTFSNNTSHSNGNVASFGGGVYAENNSSHSTTLTNVTISGNHANDFGSTGAIPGGAGVYVNSGLLTINGTSTSITGNDTTGNGGGLAVVARNASANMTNGAITNNSAAINGGGVYFTNLASGIFNQVTFTGNTANSDNAGGGDGGAIFRSASSGAMTVNFSRFHANAANTGGGGSGIQAIRSDAAGAMDATNNWWGADAAPGVVGTDNVLGTITVSPRLDLNLTPGTSTLPANASTSLTADFLTNSAGTAIPVGSLGAMIGLPISFFSSGLGATSGAQATIQANGTATATYTAGPLPGVDTVSAQVDNLPAATAPITITGGVDLAVTKTDSPDPVLAGNNITYTLTLSNIGTLDAAGVALSDTLPPGTTFITADVVTGTGWITTEIAGTVTFTKGTVTAGESDTFTIVVQVAASTPSGTTITNSATATTTSQETTQDNNTGTATTTVATEADLQSSQTDSPDPVIAGNDVTYTLTFLNNGPSDAQAWVILDTLPAHTNLVSLTHVSGPVTGGVFPAGATAVYQLVLHVNANTPDNTVLTNSAVVSSPTTDPNPANNTSNENTTVITQADLAVTKTDSPDPVIAGNTITYTVSLVNNGPSDAQTATLTDAIPANTTFVSAALTTGAGWSVAAPAVGGTGNVVFSKGTVAAGETASYTIVVLVNANTPSGATITNSATAASTTTDPTPANNTGTATTSVLTQAALTVTKTDAPDPVIAGTDLTYTLTLTNGGPSDAQTVALTDPLPANTTFVSAAVTTGTGWSLALPSVGGTGNVVFTKPTVAAGETDTFTIVVHVNPSTPNGTVIANAAVGTTTTPPVGDRQPTNIGTATTTVITRADLAVTKTDTPDPVAAGTDLTYTLTFANNGPSDAETVTLTDPLPANTTFVSAVVTTGSGWGIATPAVGGTGNVVFTKGTSPLGDAATFTIVLHVSPGVPDQSILTNVATAASATTDPTPGNNIGIATTTVQTRADLAVTKSDSPDPVIAGTNLTYTVTFANNGPSNAQIVTVTDPIPTNTTFVSAAVTTGAGWAIAAPPPGGVGTIVFSKGTSLLGDAATFTIVVRVNSSAPDNSTLSNTATAASTTTDPTPANNTATATTTVHTLADVALIKRVSAPTVVPGGSLVYTLTVTNTGPSDAQSLTLLDFTPAVGAFVSATQTSGPAFSVQAPGLGLPGGVIWRTPTLPAGATATFLLEENFNPGVAIGTPVVNQASVSTLTSDPNLGNNRATASSTVVASLKGPVKADLAVTKTVTPTPTVVAGGNLTYQVTMTNLGPGNALNVTLNEIFPAGTTLVSASQTSGPPFTNITPPGASQAGLILTALLIPQGSTATFTLVLHVDPRLGGSVLTNEVLVASTTPDPVLSNNAATVLSSVAPGPNTPKGAAVPLQASINSKISVKTVTAPAPIVRVTDPALFDIVLRKSGGRIIRRHRHLH